MFFTYIYIRYYYQSMEKEEYLEEKYESLKTDYNNFLYIISHDFNTPLRGINSLISILDEEINEEKIDKNEVQNILSLLHHSSNQMCLMFDSLLNLSKVNSENFEKQTVDLNTIITRASLELEAESHLKIICSDQLPPLLINTKEILSMIKILIENAILHCNAEFPELHIYHTESDAFVNIHFQDNGSPIEKKYRKMIWDIFRTIEGPKNNHIGSGLTLLKALMKKNNGKVLLEDNTEKNNTFILQFPKST